MSSSAKLNSPRSLISPPEGVLDKVLYGGTPPRGPTTNPVIHI